MANYVRLDKIKATAHIESIVATQDLQNGQFLSLGDLQADGEARKATPSADVSEGLVFHASVPLTYEDQTNELDFVLKAGKVGRAYVLETGDIISISESAVSGGVVKGDKVIPAVNGFAKASVAKPTGLHGKILDIEVDAVAGKLVVIRIQA